MQTRSLIIFLSPSEFDHVIHSDVAFFALDEIKKKKKEKEREHILNLSVRRDPKSGHLFFHSTIHLTLQKEKKRENTPHTHWILKLQQLQ